MLAMWRAGNGSRKLFLAYVLFLAAALVLVASIFVVWAGTEDPWDPLGNYPQQKITGSRVLSIAAGDKLAVTATKCADEQVTVTGVSRWQSVEPPGTIVLVSSGTAVRPKGCTTLDYANPIPRAIAEIVEAGGPTRWVISGTETPIRDGKQGVPRAWQTEPFQVVP